MRQRLALRAGLTSNSEGTSIGKLRGHIDSVSADGVVGWAQNVEHPEAPVCLDIFAGGRLIGQTLANRYCADLERACPGSGWHSFEFAPPPGLFALNAIEVRRSLDGAPLMRSAHAQHKEDLPTAA